MRNIKERVTSYLITVSFVVFLLFFLFSLVFLSRFVLSGESGLNTYINSTQTLFREVDRVQQEVEDINITKNDEYLDFPSSVEVIDFSTLSTNRGTSYMTFRINRTTFKQNSTLYFEPNNQEDIREGDKIMLDTGKKAYALEKTDGGNFTFYISNDKMFTQGNVSNIRGVMLYED